MIVETPPLRGYEPPLFRKKVQKKLIIQFQENCQSEGQLERRTEKRKSGRISKTFVAGVSARTIHMVQKDY